MAPPRVTRIYDRTFGWARTTGPMAQTMLRGINRIGARFTLTMAARNLARLPRLLAARGSG